MDSGGFRRNATHTAVAPTDTVAAPQSQLPTGMPAISFVTEASRVWVAEMTRPRFLWRSSYVRTARI